MHLQPSTARVLRAGLQIEIPVEQVDGYRRIHAVEKEVGDHLVGATLNGTGALHLSATKVGANSTLAQIIKLVQQAHASKAPI